MSAALGNVTWVLVALAMVLLLGWHVRQRHPRLTKLVFAGRAN